MARASTRFLVLRYGQLRDKLIASQDIERPALTKSENDELNRVYSALYERTAGFRHTIAADDVGDLVLR